MNKGREAFSQMGKRASMEARDRFEKEDKRCLNCNLPIAYEKRRQKFCSQSCSAKVGNCSDAALVARRKLTKECVCGVPIPRKRSYC